MHKLMAQYKGNYNGWNKKAVFTVMDKRQMSGRNAEAWLECLNKNDESER